MKKLILLLTLTASFSSIATEINCLDKLLPVQRTSGVHQLSREEWEDGRDVFDAEGAKASLSYLVNSKLLCRQNEVVIKVEPTCSQIAADIQQSFSCFVFTNLGYFIITRDISRTNNFIFTKNKSHSESE